MRDSESELQRGSLAWPWGEAFVRAVGKAQTALRDSERARRVFAEVGWLDVAVGHALVHPVGRPWEFTTHEAGPGQGIPLDDDPRRFCLTLIEPETGRCGCGAIVLRREEGGW